MDWRVSNATITLYRNVNKWKYVLTMSCTDASLTCLHRGHYKKVWKSAALPHDCATVHYFSKVQTDAAQWNASNLKCSYQNGGVTPTYNHNLRTKGEVWFGIISMTFTFLPKCFKFISKHKSDSALTSSYWLCYHLLMKRIFWGGGCQVGEGAAKTVGCKSLSVQFNILLI